MIESKEQFAQVIFSLAMFERDGSENSIYTMHIDELIEALRNVARAADVACGPHDGSELHAALDGLPQWVLESDELDPTEDEATGYDAHIDAEDKE